MASREFLDRACAVCARYDREGLIELPLDAWPNILDDLGLDDADEGVKILMGHLSGAGEGRFSYAPLLEALRGAPGASGGSPPGPRGGGGGEGTPHDRTQRLGLEGQDAGPPPGAGPSGRYYGLDFGQGAAPAREAPGGGAPPGGGYSGNREPGRGYQEPPACDHYDASRGQRATGGYDRSYGGGYDGAADGRGGYDDGRGGGSGGSSGGARDVRRGDDGYDQSARGCGGGGLYDGGAADARGRGGDLHDGAADGRGGGFYDGAAEVDGRGGGGGGGGYYGAGGGRPPADGRGGGGGFYDGGGGRGGGEWEARRGDEGRAEAAAPDRGPASPQPPQSVAGVRREERAAPPYGRWDGAQYALPDAGAASEEPEEVNEAFWARRASAIQQLFTKWDCNLLSNDAFTARLQEVLGESVDVSGPESDFVKLANKHRSARNMQFAALMSALRRDARATNARRLGRPLRQSDLSSYAGSYAPSAYEPSEVGSEAPSHAAGRPTGTAAVQPTQQLGGGRRHYYPENQISGGLGHSGPPPSGRAQRRLEGVDEHRPQHGGMRQMPSAGSERDADTVSVAAPSEAMSIADSQRAEFTARNRTGHGNILTWGSDSRSVTPSKQRPGRHIVVDPVQHVPRANISSGVVMPGGSPAPRS